MSRPSTLSPLASAARQVAILALGANAADRFWPKVRVAAPDDCWEWTASRTPTDYGRFSRGRGGAGWEYAHRVAWLLTHGSIPRGMCVLHACDNPPCVNPSHLFLGTQLENIADRTRKGRSAGQPNAPGRLAA